MECTAYGTKRLWYKEIMIYDTVGCLLRPAVFYRKENICSCHRDLYSSQKYRFEIVQINGFDLENEENIDKIHKE